MRYGFGTVLAAWLLWGIGCAGSGELDTGALSTDDDDAGDDDDSEGDDDASDDDDDDSADVEPELRIGRCGDPVPEGAPQPPPVPGYSMGTCPDLIQGMNTLPSQGIDRDFILVLPEGYEPGTEQLPLLFMWTYLMGDADSMLQHGQVQEAADELRFIAAIPDRPGDLAIDIFGWEFDPVWPYLNLASDDRVEQEVVFFDDVLSCVSEQYMVDDSCVSSVGVSAGALWTAQLAMRRSEYLASIISMSGGVGPATGVAVPDVRPWIGAQRQLPALIGWGGPWDYLGVNFEWASQNLEEELEDSGHFVLECVHNCGHGVPPVDQEVGLACLYRFVLDHPYWVTLGRSVYETEGLVEGTPDWCAIGVGEATPREGSCNPDDEIGQ